MSIGPVRLRGLRLVGILVSLVLATAVLSAKSTIQPPTPPAPLPLNTPRYFFNVDLDPRYQIVGEGELTPEQAATANCYCFTYDTDGKVQRIEYRRAGSLDLDPFFQVSRIDFEYGSGVEHRWYRDGNGKPALSIDGIAGEELQLNPAGYPISVTNLDSSGQPTRDNAWVIKYVRTLDAQNRLIVAHRTGLLGINITDHSGHFETKTVYDDQGRRMEYGNYDSSGNPLDDSEGVALTRTTHTIFPDSIEVIDSYFDASGLAVTEKSSGVHQLQQTFDNRGFLISEAYFDVTGAPTLDSSLGIHERRYQYDEHGNLVSDSFFDVDGRPKNQKPEGFAKLTYQYDNKNRVVTKSYYGDDGAPQVLRNLGAAIIRQEYDEQGNLVRRQFFDGLGNPSNHVRYGAPAIRIKVEGDTTIVMLRSADDKVTQNPVTGYAAFSYKTDTDQPLTRHNHFFDRHGRHLSRLRVFIINPHLYALRRNLAMALSARGGAFAAGIGSLLAMLIDLRKGSHTRRQKVYVPTPMERFVGWLGIFLIGEGIIRFFITIWWAWVGYQNGRMGYGVYVIETIYVLFFLYRLFRMRATMRVLNISKADIHGIIREYFSRAQLEPKWIEERQTFVTDDLSIRVRYFPVKCHAYLSFKVRNRHGAELERGFVQYIHAQAGTLQSFPHTRAIAFYYPCVAFCYLLLSGVAFYTFWQVVKKY
jgi:YD repeat-containing protein